MSGSIRDDPYWTSRKSNLKLKKISGVDRNSLFLDPPVVTLDHKEILAGPLGRTV